MIESFWDYYLNFRIYGRRQECFKCNVISSSEFQRVKARLLGTTKTTKAKKDDPGRDGLLTKTTSKFEPKFRSKTCFIELFAISITSIAMMLI